MINIKKICYIIGASEEGMRDASISPDKEDLIIAADGGYNTLKRMGINPDIVLGDFDSIDKIPDNSETIKYPVDKNDTDTFLAYKEGYARGYRNFLIFGAMGGRFDHTIANIQTIANIAKYGGRGFLIGDGCILTAISDSKITFPADCRGNVGVFAVGETAQGVTIEGLKYTVSDIELSPYVPLGVSNEFTDKEAMVCVKNGTLLLVWQENATDFLNRKENFLSD